MIVETRTVTLVSDTHPPIKINHYQWVVNYLRAWPDQIDRFLESNAPADHPFELDPGSLHAIPWCVVFDENGRQCRIQQRAHPPAEGTTP